jgi:uncharacterized protein YdaU (DUF1376 family)
MKQPPAFQVYARDFLVDETAHLSLEATGAYVKLLCHQWLKGSLDPDVALLARLVNVPVKEFRRVWKELADHFPVTQSDGQRRNADLELRRADSHAYLRRQAEAGRQGARARWLKRVP